MALFGGWETPVDPPRDQSAEERRVPGYLTGVTVIVD